MSHVYTEISSVPASAQGRLTVNGGGSVIVTGEAKGTNAQSGNSTDIKLTATNIATGQKIESNSHSDSASVLTRISINDPGKYDVVATQGNHLQDAESTKIYIQDV